MGDDLYLDIVAKTEMNNGCCYMGLTQQNRLLRPIETTQDNLCYWTKNDNFDMYTRYNFTPRFFPPYCHTEYPHKNEDVLVYSSCGICGQSDNIFNRLKGQARPIRILDQIFPMEQDLYVEVGEDCPSVVVVRCKEDRLNLYRTRNTGKLRLQFLDEDGDELYDFRMTALEYDQPQDSDDEALVLLGLGRPWDNNGEHDPARCYVLVLNILTQ